MAAKDLTQWHTISLAVGEGGMGLGLGLEAGSPCVDYCRSPGSQDNA